MSVKNEVNGYDKPLTTVLSFNNAYEMNQREKMFLTGENFDVEFNVGVEEPETFRAHKFILAAGSPKFSKMFELHTSSFPIRIPEIEPKMFKILLNALYLHKFSLDNHDTARTCGKLFTEFGLYGAAKECLNYVKTIKIKAENAISIFELMENDSCGIGSFECINVFRTQTREVLGTDEFLQAKPGTIATIFEQDQLNIVSENDLLNALHTYADNNLALPGHVSGGNQARFEAMILPLLKKIRFLAMPVEDLARSNAACMLLTKDQLLSIMALIIAPDGDLYELPEGFNSTVNSRAKHIPSNSIGTMSHASSLSNIQNTAQIHSTLTSDSSSQTLTSKNFPIESTCDWSLPQIALSLGIQENGQSDMNIISKPHDESGWTNDSVEKTPLGNSTVDPCLSIISNSEDIQSTQKGQAESQEKVDLYSSYLSKKFEQVGSANGEWE